MKKNFLLLTLVAFALLNTLFITCRQEYSYEGGVRAVYNLIGSPDECTNVVINGVYAAGISSDSSHYVQLSVDVTTAGNYLISTNTIDGIGFSASGIFADTGLYTIKLNANGTPDSAGIYQLQIPGNNGCFFQLEVLGKPMADYILSGTLSDCESPEINGDYEEATDLTKSNTVTVNVEVFTTGDYTITTDTTDGMFFSASGTFTATGKQKVTLAGNGQPNFAGLIYLRVIAPTTECGFQIPVRNYQPLAVYVLESGSGAINPCTPQTVNGTYTAGIPLSLDNTVEIRAFVTVPGRFTISTDSSNGMIFQYSGEFTTTDKQYVTLQGSGTPRIPGVYTFFPKIIGPTPIGGGSCGFSINVK